MVKNDWWIRVASNQKKRRRKYCKFCCCYINSGGWSKHLKTDKHKKNFFNINEWI